MPTAIPTRVEASLILIREEYLDWPKGIPIQGRSVSLSPTDTDTASLNSPVVLRSLSTNA